MADQDKGVDEPELSCDVRYRSHGSSHNDVKARISLTNTGRTTIRGWQLTWAFTGAQSVRQATGATVSQQGATVTARNTRDDSTLRPRRKHKIELVIRPGHLAAPAPELFRLNGSACRST